MTHPEHGCSRVFECIEGLGQTVGIFLIPLGRLRIRDYSFAGLISQILSIIRGQ